MVKKREAAERRQKAKTLKSGSSDHNYKGKVIVADADSPSDDDDEEICRLQQAVDPTFCIASSSSCGNNEDKQKRKHEDKNGEIFTGESSFPSNRTDLKDAEEQWNSGHYESVNISEESKKFIAKKLFSALEKQIEDIPKPTNVILQKNSSSLNAASGIYLFTDSYSKITSKDLEVTNETEFNKKQRRKLHNLKKWKRRKVVDDVESEDETTKLKSVAVCADWVLGNK